MILPTALYAKDSIERFMQRYDEAILVAKNHGTQVMVTMQILVGLNNVHSLKGGKEYSGPYAEVISVAQVFVLDIFELLHAGGLGYQQLSLIPPSTPHRQPLPLF